eukprot:c30684_g1_i1 orf=69-227(+)
MQVPPSQNYNETKYLTHFSVPRNSFKLRVSHAITCQAFTIKLLPIGNIFLLR